MGLRFRKSIKVAPGLRVNLNKKGVSITGGVKGAHYTVSSSGKRTVSAGIPGSGLSYTKTTGPKSKSSSNHRSVKSSPRGSSGNSGSCLVTCFKILGVLVLIPFILLFGWIPGIIWIIFFRGKMRNEPDRQKKYTMIISAVSVVSFLMLIFSILFSPSSLTSLMLTSNYEGQVLDINSDYAVMISGEPEDAVLSSVTYSIDNPLLANIDSSSDLPSVIVLHTTAEGTVSITARAGNIESNTLTFNITDMQKKEIENIEKGEEATEMQTEPAEKSADEEVISAKVQDAPETVTTKEEEASADIPEKSVSVVAPVVNIPEPKTETEANEPEPSSELSADSVWVSETGSKYHKINNCGRMNPNKARQIPLQDAVDRGLEQCDKCF